MVLQMLQTALLFLAQPLRQMAPQHQTAAAATTAQKTGALALIPAAPCQQICQAPLLLQGPLPAQLLIWGQLCHQHLHQLTAALLPHQHLKNPPLKQAPALHQLHLQAHRQLLYLQTAAAAAPDPQQVLPRPLARLQAGTGAAAAALHLRLETRPTPTGAGA